MSQVVCTCISLAMRLEHKQTYTDFFNAIEQAVDKRYPTDTIPTLGMGSGTDSGTIAAALHSLNKEFKLVCLLGKEDKEVLLDRVRILDQEVTFINSMNKDRILQTQKEMKSIGFDLGKHTGIGTGTSHYILAKNSTGILYSGLGTDEFYSGDHQLLCTFFYFSHISYFHFNIATKFPLLDSQVIKEFYCLDPKLRVHYKQPFHKYMEHKQFPYTTEKIYFLPGEENG